MKSLMKSFALFVAVLFITSLTVSCGSAHYGCPGQDRPSFRGGYGMTNPTMNDFQALPADKKTTSTAYINTMS